MFYSFELRAVHDNLVKLGASPTLLIIVCNGSRRAPIHPDLESFTRISNTVFFALIEQQINQNLLGA